ncbi:MAG TPA: hypothetical protein VF899_13440, partial [Pyrinomonadaceae bacterium]
GGASEYFQQILIDWHRLGPHIAVSKLTKEPWKEALGRAKLTTKPGAGGRSRWQQGRGTKNDFPFLIYQWSFPLRNVLQSEMPNDN